MAHLIWKFTFHETNPKPRASGQDEEAIRRIASQASVGEEALRNARGILGTLSLPLDDFDFGH